MRRSLRHRRAAAAIAILVASCVIAIGGCMPQPATSQAKVISDLWTVFLGAGAIVAAIVWGLITWAILRYRRPGARSDELPPQTHGNLFLEAIWTSLPVLTVLVLFGLTFAALNQVQARSPQAGVDVHVEAFQWQWRFIYPASGVTVTGQIGSPPELVVPVGQPVHVLLTSPDVNHAFYVPSFLFKRDAIPGHQNAFDFTVMSPGIYGGQCAEFCGVFHDRMLFTVRAVSASDFTSWLASARAAGGASPAAAGGGESPSASGAASPAPSASAS